MVRPVQSNGFIRQGLGTRSPSMISMTTSEDFDLDAIAAADIEGDGSVELLYGDGLGRVHVLDGETGDEQWFVRSFLSGVTRIAVGDGDGDDNSEVFFGSGFSSTGPDGLFVADGVSESMEWESLDISGPFYGFAHGDMDGDGQPEIIYNTSEADTNSNDGLYFVHDANSKLLEYQSTGADNINAH